MNKAPYTNVFFDTIRGGSRRSAQVVVPIVLQMLHPKSVVDVGRGDGTWLSVFRELGIRETVGLDGDYVDRRQLQIPQDQFEATDLSSPFGLPRTFDLAMSLEVAEHLPPQSAEGFVDCVTQLAPLVLFSAAIPRQGGTQHLNEQWPEYWAALFRARDYLPIDCIREGYGGASRWSGITPRTCCSSPREVVYGKTLIYAESTRRLILSNWLWCTRSDSFNHSSAVFATLFIYWCRPL
jgi:hypothetical protein